MSTKYKVGSLFAGIGGMELGFQQVNKGKAFEVIWANEFDEKACKTYRFNFEHEMIEQDVHELDAKNLPAVDVLTAGFPCQAFSVAGYQKGFKDPRGNLFFEIMRIVEELPEKPKVLFLENVKNFYGHDKGKTYKIVKQALESHGYSVFTEILNTAEYTEIPHNRERTFIICFRDELGWAVNNQKTKCSWIFDSLFPPSRFEKQLNLREMLEKGKVDDKYYYGEDKYMYDQLKEVMKSRDTVYQFRRIYVRENKSNQCPTLTANMGEGGHNVPLIIDDWGFRKLTPRECFRFQGFGDSFKFPKDVAMSQLYKQAGNSVSVPLIQRLAEFVKEAMDIKYS